jgi:threonine dehydratase
MLATAGWPVIAPEHAIEEACDLVRRQTGIDTDHTGASGVAGLLTLMRMVGNRPLGDERVAVIVSGRRRG